MTITLLVSLALGAIAYIVALVLILRRTAGHADEGNLAEFFVSGRNVGLGTAIATLGATEIGLITIAYNAQKGFNDGFAAFHIGAAALVGCLIVGLTGFVVAPLRKTGVLTVPEFYGQRYGQDVRVFGATVMALGGILNMGLFLKVAALFIVAMLGLEGGSAAVNALMVGLLVIAVAYTAYGGMRSVIATDVLQFVLIVAGLSIALAFLLYEIPLADAVTEVSAAKGMAGFDPLTAPSFGLSYVLWMVLVAGVVSSAIWPTALSRALCIKDEPTVRRAYLVSSLVFMGRMILPAFIGVLAFAFFAQQTGSSPAASAPQLKAFGTDADLVATAVMLGEALPGWLVGLLAIVMFASFMSTQDGYLFCWSSIIARDIIGPLTGRTEEAAFQIRATRIGIVVIALYELYWGLIYQGREDIWDYLAVSGAIYFCSGIVVLAGGLYWPRATRKGAIAALIAGFTAIAGLGPIKQALGLADVSAPVIGFAAIGLSALAFVIVSLLDEAPDQLVRNSR
ncbi:MAG: sodium:solute symporter family protein [Alphaproteobacteria bacterium]|nr:sodium:solute symporter family protein [Alphaproteobacteria bacterium]